VLGKYGDEILGMVEREHEGWQAGVYRQVLALFSEAAEALEFWAAEGWLQEAQA
jgi:hypothetical protein